MRFLPFLAFLAFLVLFKIQSNEAAKFFPGPNYGHTADFSVPTNGVCKLFFRKEPKQNIGTYIRSVESGITQTDSHGTVLTLGCEPRATCTGEVIQLGKVNFCKGQSARLVAHGEAGAEYISVQPEKQEILRLEHLSHSGFKVSGFKVGGTGEGFQLRLGNFEREVFVFSAVPKEVGQLSIMHRDFAFFKIPKRKRTTCALTFALTHPVEETFSWKPVCESSVCAKANSYQLNFSDSDTLKSITAANTRSQTQIVTTICAGRNAEIEPVTTDGKITALKVYQKDILVLNIYSKTGGGHFIVKSPKHKKDIPPPPFVYIGMVTNNNLNKRRLQDDDNNRNFDVSNYESVTYSESEGWTNRKEKGNCVGTGCFAAIAAKVRAGEPQFSSLKSDVVRMVPKSSKGTGSGGAAVFIHTGGSGLMIEGKSSQEFVASGYLAFPSNERLCVIGSDMKCQTTNGAKEAKVSCGNIVSRKLALVVVKGKVELKGPSLFSQRSAKYKLCAGKEVGMYWDKKKKRAFFYKKTSSQDFAKPSFMVIDNNMLTPGRLPLINGKHFVLSFRSVSLFDHTSALTHPSPMELPPADGHGTIIAIDYDRKTSMVKTHVVEKNDPRWANIEAENENFVAVYEDQISKFLGVVEKRNLKKSEIKAVLVPGFGFELTVEWFKEGDEYVEAGFVSLFPEAPLNIHRLKLLSKADRT